MSSPLVLPGVIVDLSAQEVSMPPVSKPVDGPITALENPQTVSLQSSTPHNEPAEPPKTTDGGPQTGEQPPQKKEPERVYEMYSWRDKSPGARLVYIRDFYTAEEELRNLPPGPLGFDMEWKPIRWRGAHHPVSLIQLASRDTILLLQITAMGGEYLSLCIFQCTHP